MTVSRMDCSDTYKRWQNNRQLSLWQCQEWTAVTHTRDGKIIDSLVYDTVKNGLQWRTLRVHRTGTFLSAISTCHEGTEGARGIALASLTLVLERGRWSLPCSGHFTPRNWAPLPNVQEAGWTWWSISMGMENLAFNGVWTQNCPARSKSLYQQNYPGHHIYMYIQGDPRTRG